MCPRVSSQVPRPTTVTCGPLPSSSTITSCAVPSSTVMVVPPGESTDEGVTVSRKRRTDESVAIVQSPSPSRLTMPVVAFASTIRVPSWTPSRSTSPASPSVAE